MPKQRAAITSKVKMHPARRNPPRRDCGTGSYGFGCDEAPLDTRDGEPAKGTGLSAIAPCPAIAGATVGTEEAGTTRHADALLLAAGICSKILLMLKPLSVRLVLTLTSSQVRGGAAIDLAYRWVTMP